jgi:AcrR family transcriptional regulator
MRKTRATAVSEGAASTERERLLTAVSDVCLERGISGMSLRALAQGAGSNNRMLLYYFGSKEQLLVAALREAGSRFPLLADALSALTAPRRPLEERLEAAWDAISAPENEPFLRLFFEVLGLSARDAARFAEFAAELITDWPARVAAALAAEGVPPAVAADLADQLVALWRGLQIELISGADRARVRRSYADAAAAMAQRIRSVSSA